jgi:hypothetical protein
MLLFMMYYSVTSPLPFFLFTMPRYRLNFRSKLPQSVVFSVMRWISDRTVAINAIERLSCNWSVAHWGDMIIHVIQAIHTVTERV